MAVVQSRSFECCSSGMHWDSAGLWGRDSVETGDACRTVCSCSHMVMASALPGGNDSIQFG